MGKNRTTKQISNTIFPILYFRKSFTYFYIFYAQLVCFLAFLLTVLTNKLLESPSGNF